MELVHVYKDGLWVQQHLVLIHVVFIYRFNNRGNITLGTRKVWSVYAGGLYIQVVVRAVAFVHVTHDVSNSRCSVTLLSLAKQAVCFNVNRHTDSIFQLL